MKTAHFYHFELNLPEQCVDDCRRVGPDDKEVALWLAKLDPATFPSATAIRAALQEYGLGMWTTSQLQDDKANLRRLVWLAACNASECEQEQAARESECAP